MRASVDDTARRLVSAGLCTDDDVLVGALDDVLVWNRHAPDIPLLAPLFDQLGPGALVCCRPAPPYDAVIDFLIEEAGAFIRPEDTETRTFLHEIPVVRDGGSAAVARALARRKGVVLADGRIAVTGQFTAEQAFMNFSSICSACLVKFLSEQLAAAARGARRRVARSLLTAVTAELPPVPAPPFGLETGPFEDEAAAQAAMIQAGARLVSHRLVDSLFGNISYRVDDTLYISQTGSALDRLAGNIDPADILARSSAAITASSELSAHLQIVQSEPVRAILHGHPPFAVVMSLDCRERDCLDKGRCHTHCPKHREIAGVPIIPGEVGTGPTGIAKTLPPAIRRNRRAIVYGHGVFSVGCVDFNEAFASLADTESLCRERFLTETQI